MDAERCIPIEEIQDAIAASPADPRRRHLETCPRCHARALALQEFIGVPSDVDADMLAAADSRLAAALHREIAGAPVPSARRDAPRSRAPWNFAWAGIAFAAVALFAVHAARDRGAEAPGTLRGGGEHATEGPASLRTDPGDGKITLRWSPVAGADEYRIIIYGADLTELARLAPVADTVLVVTRAQLPASIEPGASAFWSVTACARGDSLHVSAPASLRLP